MTTNAFVTPSEQCAIISPTRIYFSLYFFLFQGEVIDVSYGNADDLKKIKKIKNVTNQIALLKLGKLPLLYKVGSIANFWWWGEYFVLLCWSYIPL